MLRPLHCCVFLICSAVGFAQKGSAAHPLPAPLVREAHTLVHESRRHFEVANPAEATYTVHEVVTVLNDASPYQRLYVFYDDHARVTDFGATIYDARGKKVDKLKRQDAADASAVTGGTIYSDSRYLALTTARARFPYTIDYTYTKRYDGLQSYPDFDVQGYGTGVVDAEFIISVPVDQEVHYRALNTDCAPVVTEKEGRRRYRWTVHELPPVAAEAGAPGAADVLPRVLTAPSRFRIDDYTGSMSDWTAFGEFIYRINDGRSELSAATKREVAALIADAATPAEKVSRLYRYVQENMRYVSVQLGIGGWQTYPADYVEANRYGDCKALSYFTRALLHEAGIEALPVLVAAGERPGFEVDASFTVPYFNHMILYVPDVDYWLECTSKSAPPNYLGTFTADRNVLLIRPTGGQLGRTPPVSAATNQTRHRATVELTDAGAATLTDRVTATGPAQEAFRERAFYQSDKELQDWYTRRAELPGFRGFRHFELRVDADRPRAELAYTAELDSYGSRNGSRLFMPLNVLSDFTELPPADGTRQQAYVRPYGAGERDTITFLLPAGTTAESLPEPQSLDSPYGTYRAAVTVGANRLVYTRRLTVPALTVPAADYPAYREFWKTVRKMDRAQAVLKMAVRP